MKQAIVNFCKSTDTGLFLLDMPTGFGKTYSVLEFMVDYYDSPEFKDKKIFFVTTLKKNLPDKELREHFAKRGKADDYDKYCLRIEANADMVSSCICIFEDERFSGRAYYCIEVTTSIS